MTREQATDTDIDRVYARRERKAIECCQATINDTALRLGLRAFGEVHAITCAKCGRAWKRRADESGGWERAA